MSTVQKTHTNKHTHALCGDEIMGNILLSQTRSVAADDNPSLPRVTHYIQEITNGTHGDIQL